MSIFAEDRRSLGARIVDELEEDGLELRAGGMEILARPALLLTTARRARIEANREAVLCALQGRDVMSVPLRPCADCLNLEDGVYCTRYRHVMPEPIKAYRCIYFKEAMPWR